jgi:hypothetical protein
MKPLAARLQYPSELGLDARRIERQRIRRRVADADPTRCVLGGLERPLPKVWLGLEGHHLLDQGGVVLEVHAVAGADFEHPAGQTGEELVAILTEVTLPGSA